MAGLKLFGLCIFVFLAVFVSFVFAADVITFEANIFDNASARPVLELEVPDFVFLGNVTVGEKSNEVHIYINNTGTVDALITPELVNSGEDIFNYLYFRGQKTHTVNGTSGVPVPFERIGDFSFTANKPTTGNNFNAEDFYSILDLTNYSGSITGDLIGRRADVKLVAVAA